MAPPWVGVLLCTTLLIALIIQQLLIRLRDYVRQRLKTANIHHRQAILDELGISAVNEGETTPVIVGLFHPYCNAGGGGERVLWAAIACMQREQANLVCVIYTGDVGVRKQDMVNKAKTRFAITVDGSRIHLIYLRKRQLIEDARWPRFTLLGQSLGSVVLGYEALRQLIPDVFIDTMGYAFTYPLVKMIAVIPVGAYVHYPTISTNMLQRVRQRAAGHTNTSGVAASSVLSAAKLYYYLIFAKMYSYCLRQADSLAVNSSWTKSHVDSLLSGKYEYTVPSSPEEAAKLANNAGSKVIFPSCDTASLSSLSLDSREDVILSVAQFRPEKEHNTQLRALQAYFDFSPRAPRKMRLVLAGSVRNKGDEDRVTDLEKLAKELGIEDNVTFVINPPWPDLVKLFGRASIGLSTMIDEHFGINVVEFMAAGLITVAHASGGPLLDIVVPQEEQPTGFHASTIGAFARRLNEVLVMPEKDKLAMRRRARALALEKFSEANFDEKWLSLWSGLNKRKTP